MSESMSPTSQEAYNRCEDQLERARMMLNMYAHGDNTRQLVNAIRRVSWAVAALNDTVRTLNERVDTLAITLDTLAGDDFGDGLPF